MEKQYITLGELVEGVHSVQERAAGRTTQSALEAEPASTGNEKIVVRNRHNKDAVGKGDPQCFKGMAGKARFSVGDKVRVRKLPTILYSSTQEYLRGAPGDNYQGDLREPRSGGRSVQPRGREARMVLHRALQDG